MNEQTEIVSYQTVLIMSSVFSSVLILPVVEVSGDILTLIFFALIYLDIDIFYMVLIGINVY